VNKREAERRARRIRAFREELSTLEVEGVLHLPAGEAARVSAHHDDLLARFSDAFDTDLNEGEARLSWGMRLVSLIGAVALCLAIFLFFNHYWDDFSTGLQIALVTLAPFLGWGITEFVARRFKTRYFTQLAALVAIACFVLNLYLLGEIYNITPSPYAFLVWGSFALFLGIRHDLDVIQGLGLASLGLFLGALLTKFAGFYWLHEVIAEFYLAAFALILLAPLLPFGWLKERRLTFYYIGMLGIFLLLLSLVTLSPDSLLPFDGKVVGWIYLIVALAAGGGALALCLRAGWGQGAYLAAGFLIVFLLLKYFDWFWDKWPAYVFFLVLGLLAIAVIAALRKLRLKGRARA
jgi:peptidoglycan/LPS O-acetylase OafA/YrhL|tara:strand:+ start:1854 stop:2903 length:1050 start_codon:yes stop_codon:yes gene_type:complete